MKKKNDITEDRVCLVQLADVITFDLLRFEFYRFHKGIRIYPKL